MERRDAMHHVSTTKTFVGFGFGAIQAGLFLSQASKQFDRLVVAYRRPEIIAAIRENNGYFGVNIAHNDFIEKTKVGAIEIYDVNNKNNQTEIIAAIAEASELATALSSTKDYVSDSDASIHKLLAKGLRKKLEENKPACIIYAAENDNTAAQKLKAAILNEISETKHKALIEKFQILNTVIGKMSITIREQKIMQEQKLAPIATELEQAFLVEDFSHILIDKINLADFKRGIKSFVEKDDLLPFEEAKLYGHNAIHAMAAYLAIVNGVNYIKDLDQNIIELLRITFKQELGAALVKKYNGVDDLFTAEGFKDYAENLLERMQNPYLNDTAERVGRDVERKLGWNDRLIGAMRLCLAQGIEPKRLAFGVAAALQTVNQAHVFKNYLSNIWKNQEDKKKEETRVLEYIQRAIKNLNDWQPKTQRTKNH